MPTTALLPRPDPRRPGSHRPGSLQPDPPRRIDLPRRLAALIAVAILLCLLGFSAALLSIQARVDARAQSESVRHLATRVLDLRLQLSSSAVDYNHWTEAYERMMAFDMAWIVENYAITAVEGDLFDGLILMGGPFAAPMAWQAGTPHTVPSFLPPATLDRLRAGVGAQAMGTRRTFDMMTVVDGRLVLLSATRTQPLEEERLARLNPRSLPIAVLSRAIGPAELGGLRAAIGLSELSFVPGPGPDAGPDARPDPGASAGPDLAPGLAALPIHGPDGEVLGVLAWPPPRPGRDLLATMAPVLLLAAAAFAGLGGAAAWLAHDHAGRLVREGARARSLARTDPMTGLPNRLAFTEHLADIERAGLPHVAVLFTDLNGFKRINDTVGHAGGDAVVAGLAARLAPLAGPDTFLARLGGDEFVWVLASDEGVAARAGALTEAVRARVAAPFPVLGQIVRLSLSQGLALRDAPDVALDELVRRADLAMYRAKRDRSALVRPWSPDLDGQGGRDLDLERALRDALARPHEFTLHYQPIVDAATHGFRRAEALARWRSPTLGQVPPDRFIAAAEAAGLIGELGRLLLERVAVDLARAPGLRVGVNLSPLQLVDPAFGGDAAAILARHGVDPSRIELELTEGVLIDSAETAALRLDALSDMGFSIALDDFGTGFSSIGYLRRMPFDTLKIDRSFLLPDAGEGMALVEAVARLGQVIGKVVVCEGVETEAQAEALRRAGCCHLLQGYRFGRPMPLDALLALPGVPGPSEAEVSGALGPPGTGLRSPGPRTCS